MEECVECIKEHGDFDICRDCMERRNVIRLDTKRLLEAAFKNGQVYGLKEVLAYCNEIGVDLEDLELDELSEEVKDSLRVS